MFHVIGEIVSSLMGGGVKPIYCPVASAEMVGPKTSTDALMSTVETSGVGRGFREISGSVLVGR